MGESPAEWLAALHMSFLQLDNFVVQVIAPGDRWKYESGTTLPTQFGSMLGSFQFDHIRQTGRSGHYAALGSVYYLDFGI